VFSNVTNAKIENRDEDLDQKIKQLNSKSQSLIGSHASIAQAANQFKSDNGEILKKSRRNSTMFGVFMSLQKIILMVFVQGVVLLAKLMYYGKTEDYSADSFEQTKHEGLEFSRIIAFLIYFGQLLFWISRLRQPEIKENEQKLTQVQSRLF